MIDGNGLLCCSHGEQFSLNTKANVDIVTKLDGSHMVWRNQVESVKRVIAFLFVVKVWDLSCQELLHLEVLGAGVGV